MSVSFRAELYSILRKQLDYLLWLLTTAGQIIKLFQQRGSDTWIVTLNWIFAEQLCFHMDHLSGEIMCLQSVLLKYQVPPLSQVHIKDYKDLISWVFVYERMCGPPPPTDTPLTKRRPRCWLYTFWTVCLMKMEAQLNNTSTHAYRRPPLFLQGSRGNRRYPREASACWAADSCTWPLQLGPLKGNKIGSVWVT